MTKKILYLSYDGLTDPLGQSQILPYLLGLSQKGYQITIISAEKNQNFAKRQNIIQNLLAGTSINWQPIFYTKSPPILSTLWDLLKMRKKAKKLHASENFQIIHCRSYLTSLIGLYFKRKYKTAFIFDMRGFWADERVEGNLWNLKNPIFRFVYQFFKKKEKQFLQQADATISLTENAKQEILSWQGFQNTPIAVIPCCVDLDLFDYEKYSNSKKAISPTSSITFSYLGSLGTWYMLEEMLLFFKEILQRNKNAKFLFITPDDPSIILAKASALGIDPTKLSIQKAERKEVPHLLAQSHIAIFFIKPSYSKKASSATKMGEILAMGIPIITNTNVGDHDLLFAQNKIGWLIDNFDEKSYQEATAQVDELLEISSASLSKVAEGNFSLISGVERYHTIYQKLLKIQK